MSLIPFCFNCEYYKGDFKCEAFPEEIPHEILADKERHDHLIPGQEGDYLYSPIDPDLTFDGPPKLPEGVIV